MKPKILILTKRYYTNQDLIHSPFGRLHHFPNIWVSSCDVRIVALDYYGTESGHSDNRPYPIEYIGVRSALKIIGLFPLLKKKTKSFKPDVIVASGDIIVGALASRMSKAYKLPWFYDIYDDYRKFSLSIYTGLSLLFPSLCKSATGLLCVSEELRSICSAWNKSIHIAYNGYDPIIFQPANKNIARDLLDIEPDHLLIVYTGSIDSRFDTKLIVETMDALSTQHAKIKLAHAGTGRLDLEHTNSWYIHLGVLDQKSVAKLIQSADVCIAPYRDTALSQSCNPCKIAEYLACNVTVVASAITPIKALSNHDILLYKPSDNNDFLQCLNKALETNPKTSPNTALQWSLIAKRCLSFIESSYTS